MYVENMFLNEDNDMKKSNNKKAYDNPDITIEYLDTQTPLMTSIDDTTNTRDNDNPDPFD